MLLVISVLSIDMCKVLQGWLFLFIILTRKLNILEGRQPIICWFFTLTGRWNETLKKIYKSMTESGLSSWHSVPSNLPLPRCVSGAFLLSEWAGIFLSLRRAFRYSHSSFTNRCTFIATLITIYIKIRWLLHVSVYDHHQGACNWACLKLYRYLNTR